MDDVAGGLQKDVVPHYEVRREEDRELDQLRCAHDVMEDHAEREDDRGGQDPADQSVHQDHFT